MNEVPCLDDEVLNFINELPYLFLHFPTSLFKKTVLLLRKGHGVFRSR